MNYLLKISIVPENPDAEIAIQIDNVNQIAYLEFFIQNQPTRISNTKTNARISSYGVGSQFKRVYCFRSCLESLFGLLLCEQNSN